MDFKKIERILILAFVLLNLFLVYIIIEQRGDLRISSQSQEIDVMEEMQNNNISLPELDQERLHKYYVQATKTGQLAETASEDYPGQLNEEEELYVEDLQDPIILSDEETITEADIRSIDQYIHSDAVLNGSEYEYFTYLPESRQVIYTQRADGVPIADGTSSIRLSLNDEGNVTHLEQSFAGIFSQQGESKELYSDREAVIALFQRNLIPPNSEVAKPVLTYFRTLDLGDISMYIPVWYVEIKTENESFVEIINALNLTTIAEAPASAVPEGDLSQEPSEQEPAPSADQSNIETEAQGQVEERGESEPSAAQEEEEPAQ